MHQNDCADLQARWTPLTSVINISLHTHVSVLFLYLYGSWIYVIPFKCVVHLCHSWLPFCIVVVHGLEDSIIATARYDGRYGLVLARYSLLDCFYASSNVPLWSPGDSQLCNSCNQIFIGQADLYILAVWVVCSSLLVYSAIGTTESMMFNGRLLDSYAIPKCCQFSLGIKTNHI